MIQDALRVGVVLCGSLFLHAFDPCAAQKLLASPTIRVTYIPFRANSLEDFSTKLLREGPTDHLQVHRYAVTDWSIRWWQEKKKMIHTELSVKVTLPKWMTEHLVSDCEYRAWAKAFATLLEHELGHASKPFVTIEKMESMGTQAIEAGASIQEVDGIVRKSLLENNKFDLQYDHDTDHGRNQGLKLPACDEGKA